MQFLLKMLILSHNISTKRVGDVLPNVVLIVSSR